MAEILIFHHIQGLTEGVLAFAEDLRQDGHIVHAPDLFGGETFDSIEEGFGFAQEKGFDSLREHGIALALELGQDLVYVGFSFGVTIAQQLAQTRPGARGALLLHSCLPITEFSESWPDGVPVQIHGNVGDEYFDEDLPAARALAESSSAAELFLYPGDEHLFTDRSLPAFDPESAALLMSRVRPFLAAL